MPKKYPLIISYKFNSVIDNGSYIIVKIQMVEGFYDHANIYKKVKTLKDEHKVYFPRGTKQKDIIKELDKWMKETYRYHKPIKKKDHDPLIEKTYKFKALEIRPRTKPKITVC